MIALAAGCTREPWNLVGRGACGAADGGPEPEPTRPAADLLDTFGLAVDLSNPALRARDGRSPLDVARELGVRHIRGAVHRSATELRLNAIPRDELDLCIRTSRETDLATLWPVTDATVAVEGPGAGNDPAGGVNSPAVMTAAVRALHDGAANLPASQRPRIVGPTINTREEAQAIGDLSGVIDFGGMRVLGSGPPSWTLGQWLGLTKIMAPSGPVMLTSAFYPGRDDADARAAGLPSERTQAKYVVRQLLLSYSHGLARTYYDDLYDDPSCSDGGCAMGLMHGDGTDKAALRWWRALRTALTDDATAPAMASTTIGLTFESSAADAGALQHVLLRRRDAFALVLWLEVEAGARDASAPIVVRTRAPVLSATQIPLDGGPAQSVAASPELSITVTDAPSVLILRPGC
jgi:hypothetical protein